MDIPDIRLLLSDVDGTLVAPDHSLPASAVDAVRALRDRGIGFAVASSRPPRGMAMFVAPLGLRDELSGFNGGVVTDCDLRIRVERPLPEAVARAAHAALAAAGLSVWLFSGNDWFVDDPDGPHVARETHAVAFPPVAVPAYGDAMFAAVAKIVGVSDDHDLVARAEAALRERLAGQATASRSQRYYLDVTSPAANKGQVVRDLAARHGLSPSQVAAIGDSHNDLPMFEQAGFAIAMGNASDAVKAAADMVTDRNDADGFAKGVAALLAGLARTRGAA